MPSTNEALQDDLIHQEVDVRRVTAAIEKEVDQVLLQLGKDLKTVLARIDPVGTKQSKARKRRLLKLDKESKRLTKAAYTKIDEIVKTSLKRLSRAESAAVSQALQERIP